MAHNGRTCVMGCELIDGRTLHKFPQDAKRRAEWCRIMGVCPRNRCAYLCSEHIPYYFIQGNRVSRFAVPNPPESRKVTASFLNSYDGYTTMDDIKNDILNLGGDVESCPEEKQEKAPDAQNKIEDFEIRKGNNDMIIKGRFIQTDNYLMVSYTPPKKWLLQKQVKLLDGHCTQQLNQIRQITKENLFLRANIRKYEKLLPKLRYLQRQNLLLYAQLKIYKLRKKAV